MKSSNGPQDTSNSSEIDRSEDKTDEEDSDDSGKLAFRNLLHLLIIDNLFTDSNAMIPDLKESQALN